jgi:N-acetylneuraminic acid mutarotase
MTYKEIRFWGGIVLMALALPALNSCKSPSTDLIGNWVKLSSLDGVSRSEAVGFSIGTKGYVGTGYNSDDDIRLKDFWEYDAARDTWTQKADFPGVARNAAVGFGTDTKGYIGTGYDGKNKLKDFYEFDPVANAWTQKAEFPGSGRYSAIAMNISNIGYVGTGYDGNYLKDFYKYDPSSDTWTQISSIGGNKRMDAACFVISGKGYVATGSENQTNQTDFWMYDPSVDTWTKKRAISNLSDDSYDDSYTTIVGTGKVGFTIGSKGYLATGGSGVGVETWEYDPAQDLWTEKTNFEGSSRTEAVGFVIGTRGYLATGKSSGSSFDDLWAFDPDAEYNKND